MSSLSSPLTMLVLTGAAYTVVLVLRPLPESRFRSAGLELSKHVVFSCLVLLTILPEDLMPDSRLDDAGYLVGAYLAFSSAVEDLKRRQAEEARKRALLARETGIASPELSAKGGDS